MSRVHETSHAESANLRAPILSWSDADRLFCMCSSPGGRLYTGGNGPGDVTIWDSRTGLEEHQLPSHTEAVLALFSLPELKYLFSASADGTVRLWNMDTLQNGMVYEGHKGFVVGLFALSLANATGLFTGSDDRTIKQWNINSGACVHTFKGHKGPVNAITGTQEYLFSVAGDGRLKVWNHLTQQCVRTIEAHSDAIWDVAIVRSGGGAGGGGGANSHISSSQLGAAPGFSTMDTYEEQEYPDCDVRLVTAGSDGIIRVWADVLGVAPAIVAELNHHIGKVRKLLAWGQVLFSAGADAGVLVWDVPTGSCIGSLSFHTKQVTGLALENNQLCTASFDRQIARWDVVDLLHDKQPIRPYEPLQIATTGTTDLGRMNPDARDMIRRNKGRLEAQTIDEIAVSHQELPVNFVVKALLYKVEAARLSVDILLYIPFLLLFLFVFVLGNDSEETYYMVQGLDDVLTGKPIPSFLQDRTFETVTESSFFYRWCSSTMDELWANRNEEAFPVIHGQNILFGTLRFRVQRVDPDSCTFNSAFVRNATAVKYEFNDNGEALPCFGALTDVDQSEKPYMCPGSARKWCPTGTANEGDLIVLGFLPPHNDTNITTNNGTTTASPADISAAKFEFSEEIGLPISGLILDYARGGFYYDIPIRSTTLEDAKAKLAALQRVGFIDDIATRFVEVSFYVYNPALDLFLANRHFFEVPIGGTWRPLYRHVPFSVFTPTEDVTRLVFEFIFVVVVAGFIVMFVWEGIQEAKSKRLVSFLVNGWNLIEMINLIMFVITFVLRWVWMANSAGIPLGSLLQTTTHSNKLTETEYFYDLQGIFTAVNTVLTFLKLLKYVRLNSRLNILTRTLSVTMRSLLGVLVLFVWAVLGFAITAHALYGNNIFHFSTIGYSYISLLRMAMGEGDYDALSQEQRAATLFFYWSYQILCQFILLNFLVAVISAGFASVSAMQSSVPLDKSILKVFQDARYEVLPKTLRQKLLLLRHRRTQSGIIKETVEILMDKRKAMVEEDEAERDDYDSIEDVTMNKDDLVGLVPESVKEYVNSAFVDEIWKDLAWEHHHLLLGAKGQDTIHREHVISEEVGKALRPLVLAMPAVDKIRMSLEQQFAQLEPFAASILGNRDVGDPNGAAAPQ